MKSWSWVVLILLTIAIKWVSLYPAWVERYYTYGLYPLISRTQRFLFGWIPFSIGDLFYGFLILILVFRLSRFFWLLFKRRLNRHYFIRGSQQLIFLFLFVYVFFNLLWALNYNRLGISHQLAMQVQRYSTTDLDTLAQTLEKRLNYYAAFVTDPQRDSFNRKRLLFRDAREAYAVAARKYPFLSYPPHSVKPSIFSYAGNFLGFQGYYNPFSGEAQVNTTIPRVWEPFVTAHEMAHQLGYAKENEANFVGFLASREGGSVVLKYSMYFDMYNYAISEYYRRDSAAARQLLDSLHPQVDRDRRECRAFLEKYQNRMERVIMWAYGHYLKANNQPGGKNTYNEVVAWLIAYYKKFGVEAL